MGLNKQTPPTRSNKPPHEGWDRLWYHFYNLHPILRWKQKNKYFFSILLKFYTFLIFWIIFLEYCLLGKILEYACLVLFIDIWFNFNFLSCMFSCVIFFLVSFLVLFSCASNIVHYQWPKMKLSLCDIKFFFHLIIFMNKLFQLS